MVDKFTLAYSKMLNSLNKRLGRRIVSEQVEDSSIEFVGFTDDENANFKTSFSGVSDVDGCEYSISQVGIHTEVDGDPSTGEEWLHAFTAVGGDIEVTNLSTGETTMMEFMDVFKLRIAGFRELIDKIIAYVKTIPVEKWYK